MRILRTRAEVSEYVAGVRRAGQRLALVPTMGALHDGHLSLMKEGRARADQVAVTLFVNPTQFGPNEDLARYPRDLDGDARKCDSVGVDVLYAPEPSEVYPPGFQTYVNVEQVSQGLCGSFRPGHFRGVATVVTKLLALFRPDVALFGEKDYQQLQVIRTLNRDLDLGVTVVGVPTLREADGLAMSSRNVYLSADERRRALSISRGMQAAQAMANASPRSEVSALQAAVRQELASGEVRVEYVEIVDAQTLAPMHRLQPGRPARLLVAGYVGKTRLIDNASLGG